MMTLPPAMAADFSTEIQRYEEENQMPYITSIESLATEKGRQEGHSEGKLQKSREAIFEVLQLRFKNISNELVNTINQIQDEATLTSLLRQSVTTESMEAFERLIEFSTN